MARDLPKIRSLSANPAMDQFLTEIQSETDRAAAILGAAMLDNLLGELIEASLTSAAVASKLLNFMGPLGSFSARITFSEATGLLSVDDAADLNRIRDIRNDFAHKLDGLSFATPSVRDRCGHFRNVNAIYANQENLTFTHEYPSSARANFNLAVAASIMQLTERLKSPVRLSLANNAIDWD